MPISKEPPSKLPTANVPTANVTTTKAPAAKLPTATMSGPTSAKAVTPAPAAPTATIIPFPPRPAKPAATPPEAITPDIRLARALASLRQALEEQRAAVAAWRNTLGELKTVTNGLHDSLQRYRANLNTLASNVSDLNFKARALAEWADGATNTTH